MTWCSYCGEFCEVIDIDVGFGHTEYWGASSVHEDWVEVSSCCEADVIDDEEDWEEAFPHKVGGTPCSTTTNSQQHKEET